MENQATGWSGLDRIRLRHEALPDLDFADIQLASTLLGHSLQAPFYIAGMTAGHPDAPLFNQRLAEACQRRGWAMGLGSQRRDLEALESLEAGAGAGVDRWSEFRTQFPNLILFANLGISQVIHCSLDRIRSITALVGAQALVIHTNALQETLQVGGTPSFKGCFHALEKICSALEIPVVLKETGCGFSSETLRRLKQTGLDAIDVSGLGGTHWGRIEGARAAEGTLQAAAAPAFADWGVPTTEAVLAAKRELPAHIEIWASGGVRTGLDAAKLLALGAHQVGFAKPALDAAQAGPEALDAWMAAREYELRVALFCTGLATPAELRTNPGVIHG